MDKEKLNVEALEDVAGGNDGMGGDSWRRVMASVEKGYLALRNYPSYDEKNEILPINNGEYFFVDNNRRSGSYVWAAAHGKEGWVNSNYIIWC